MVDNEKWRCKNCAKIRRGCSCYYLLPEDENACNEYVRKRWKFWAAKLLLITLALLLAGCSPGQHHGHIYIHDPNHVEVQFDRPMSMSVDRDGVKVEASSMQPGFFEDIIKFLLLRPR